jgi:hypothetical protein
MSKWQEEDSEQDQWPVTYPTQTPPREASGHFREPVHPRWAETGKTDTSEVRKRLLWLLLAVEIGVVLAAGCVLPLAFVRLPDHEDGVVGAILAEVGHLLGLSSQATCLILGLPIPILLLTLGLNLALYRWLRQREGG